MPRKTTRVKPKARMKPRTKPKPKPSPVGKGAREALERWLFKTETSVVELARLVNIARPTAYAYLYGHRRPHRKIAGRLERTTGIRAWRWHR
jgi:hypothetical protein